MIARSSIVRGEQLHLVGKGTLEPVGKLDSADGADEARELRSGSGGHGNAREHHGSEPTRGAAPPRRRRRAELRGASHNPPLER